MCGMSGIFGVGINHIHKLAAIDLMYMNMFRGSDSTGIVLIDENRKTDIYRELGTPENIWFEGKFREDFDKNIYGFIAHNRAATKGTVTIENAHPFQHKHIVGMHNGTLWNYDNLDDAKECDTDSEAIIRTVANRGLSETYKMLKGAAAIIFFNKADSTLSIVRNRERPLHLLQFNDKNVIAWSSEEGPLTFIKKKYFPAETNEIIKIKEDHWLKYKLKNNRLVLVQQHIEPHKFTSSAITYGRDWWDKNKNKLNDNIRSKIEPNKGVTRSYMGGKTTTVSRKMNDGSNIRLVDFEKMKDMHNCCVCDTPINFQKDEIVLLEEGLSCCDRGCSEMYFDMFPFVNNNYDRMI